MTSNATEIQNRIENKKDYLEEHLKNEVEWLLRAATQWHVERELDTGIGGFAVQVYAMDSTFVHARALFEFLTQKETNNHHSCNQYSIKPLTSEKYEKWKSPLHQKVMHMQERSSSEKLASFGDKSGPKDLEEMPVDFAKETVRLWREFSQKLKTKANEEELCTIANQILCDAIKSAQAVIDSKLNQDHYRNGTEEGEGKVVPNINWP